MNNFDKEIRKNANFNEMEIPKNASEKIDNTINSLPEMNVKVKKINFAPKVAAVAASFAFLTLVLVPNISSVYAKTLEKIPVIGSIVKVTTVRNYYADATHEMDVSMPKIEGNDAALEYVNKSVEQLTNELVERFYDDVDTIGNEGHSSIYMDYDVVTNNDKWFTLKITLFEAAGSSNTYFKYYHIDKEKGEIVKLGDIVKSDKFYSIVKEDIASQMREAMKADSNKIYWVDDDTFGDIFETLNGEHNFYFDDNGNLVVVFDKYEVAPGYMGTSEFTVSYDKIKNELK